MKYDKSQNEDLLEIGVSETRRGVAKKVYIWQQSRIFRFNDLCKTGVSKS